MLAPMQAFFDTLAATRRLEDAGMERRQAEAVAETAREAAAASLREVATKADLKADLATLETRLTRWILGATLTIIGVVVGAAVAASNWLFAALKLVP